MGSLLRTAKKHKKSRRLGKPEVMAREEYGELEVDVKIEMIRSLIPLGLMHVHELLDDEVKELAGERYARKGKLERGRRHGTNPGTVGLAGQRVPIRVPRVRSQEGVEIPLRSYEALNDGGEVNDLLLKRVLYGISCRNYEAAAEAIPGAIGLSSSTVSRGFVQASAAKLREMQERDLSGEDVVALFLDGKSFADAMMVIALGITLSGEKRFLGFVETDTENEKVLTPFLRSLLARGLDSSQGLLVIIDGGKGLKAAVKKAFRKRVLIQRCQWHKREKRRELSVQGRAGVVAQAVAVGLQQAGIIKRPSRPSINCTMNWRSGTNPQLGAWRKESRRRSHCIVSACTGRWAVRSRRRTALNPSMLSSRNAARRSTTGRTPANASGGWRQPSWTSNPA